MAGKNHNSRKSLEERDRQIEERICVCLGLPRTNASGDSSNQGRGAIPIASFVVVAEAVKRYLLADPGDEVPPYIEVIEEMTKTVVSGDKEQTAARRGVLTELNRWSTELWESATLVDFLRIIAARALMPTILSQSKAYFRGKYVPVADSEDLSALVIEKLLAVLKIGKAPNGNFGAYVSKMRWRIFVDYLRKLRRTRARFAEASDAVEQAQAKDGHAQQTMFACYIKELPPIQRTIFQRRSSGDSWTEIAAALGITAKEALQLAQRAWPGGLSSPRISRNRRCISRRTCSETFVNTSMSA
jgi:DNA-directed RNA polymerase specialized sigma24 family protein